MSVTEISKSIARLSPDQRAAVVRFVSRVRRSNSPASQRQLGAAMRAMDAGEKYSWTEVKRARATGVIPKR